MHLYEVKTQQALRTQIIDAFSKVIALGSYRLHDASQTSLNSSLGRAYQSFKSFSLSLLYAHKYLYTYTNTHTYMYK